MKFRYDVSGIVAFADGQVTRRFHVPVESEGVAGAADRAERRVRSDLGLIPEDIVKVITAVPTEYVNHLEEEHQEIAWWVMHSGWRRCPSCNDAGDGPCSKPDGHKGLHS